MPIAAQAGYYTFQPSPSADLWDLDHYRYYTWGIAWTPLVDEEIKAVSLFVDNINDWKKERNDHLYIHLLDDPSVGVSVGWDGQRGGDYFAGMGPLVANYSDNTIPANKREDLAYDFGPALVDALIAFNENNGIFGLGFDADCHYYNDGITLAIQTTTPEVPEPGTATLALLATGCLSWTRRRRAT